VLRRHVAGLFVVGRRSRFLDGFDPLGGRGSRGPKDAQNWGYQQSGHGCSDFQKTLALRWCRPGGARSGRVNGSPGSAIEPHLDQLAQHGNVAEVTLKSNVIGEGRDTLVPVANTKDFFSNYLSVL
jgi:hypothetical protein